MYCRNSIKYALFFLIMFNSIKSSFAVECGTGRFEVLKTLRPLMVEIQIDDFTIQKKEIQSRINNLKKQIQIKPISLNAKTSNTHNFSDLKKSNHLQTQKNSIDILYDLNIIKSKNSNRQKELQIEILEFELSELHTKEAVVVYEGLLEYLMGMELNQYFEIEKRYFEVKRDYLNERKEFGDLNLENLLEVEKEIRNISDKILANSVRQIERLEYLNITNDFIPPKIIISDNIINILPKSCTFKPSSAQGLVLDKELVNQQLLGSEPLNRAQLNLKLQLSDEYSSNVYQNNLGASIELQVPIYDGGILAANKMKILSEEKIIETKIRIETRKFNSSIASRISTEQVFFESFKSIEREITSLKLSSAELETRQDMGQGVFEQRINNNLQILNLQQAKLRLLSDFLSGWVRFLGTVKDGLE